MSELRITESAVRSNNIVYLYSSLGDIITQMNAHLDAVSGRNRAELVITYPDCYKEVFVNEAEDKIADVIAVNYKYNYFSKNIKAEGLSDTERELLLMALISADLDEDKKYVVKKLSKFDEYAIDGIFNFRMQALKEKWAEITDYIPAGFVGKQLRDFITYLIKDKRGKKVYVENGNVYDRHYNLLKRRCLVDGDKGQGAIIKEVILSGCGEVELASKLPEIDEFYMKEYFGDKITFSENYFATK